MLTLPDQLSQASMMDEFSQDLLEILPSLLITVRFYSEKANKGGLFTEESTLITEIVFKSLSLMEQLVASKNTKTVFKDVKENCCVRLGCLKLI